MNKRENLTILKIRSVSPIPKLQAVGQMVERSIYVRAVSGREAVSHCCLSLNVQLLPIGQAGTNPAKALSVLTVLPHSKQVPPLVISLGISFFSASLTSKSPPGNKLGSPRRIIAENDS